MIPFHDPAVLVDSSTADDAAVYRLDENRALVATVDFFTPMVDDAYDFGRIAAANALSDVYAMGGRPLFAMNLVAFPRDLLSEDILPEIIRGASDIAREAGIPVVGGHSVDDPEPKFGMCVLGEVHPDHIIRNNTAAPGDVIVLTKPIGTGVIATAIKREAADADVIAAAVASMTRLNRDASAAMIQARVRAATDVTGFGLLGHLRSVMRQSAAGCRITASAVPLLPGARALADGGFIPGGTARNAADVASDVTWEDGVADGLRTLLCDAQTSGGLLIFVRPEQVDALLDALHRGGDVAATVIGGVTEGAGIRVLQ
jgi:selenide,water dikinase